MIKDPPPMISELVQITEQLIRKGESGVGGWNQEQLEVIGVAWPPQHGWRRRACKRWISKADAEKFVRLRGIMKKLRRKIKPLSELILNFDAEKAESNDVYDPNL